MARSRGGAQGEDAQVRVRCPNPDCETVYEVSARHAGKRARCAECGAVTVIPAPRASTSEHTPAPVPRARVRTAPPAAAHPKPAPRQQPKRTAAPGREVRIGCIGRGHAGKTALFQVLGDTLVGDYLPSGLHLDAA